MAKAERKGAGKKSPAAADTRKPKHSNDVNRPSKGVGFQRDAATVGGNHVQPRLSHAEGILAKLISSCLVPTRLQVRRLNMYKKRPVRDKKGKLIHEVNSRQHLQSNIAEAHPTAACLPACRLAVLASPQHL
jgi:hypothetical protein